MENQSSKYLTFFLGNEIYGLPITKAKEIIGMMEITPIPKTQNHLKGVINLRGKIIPIMDLRLRFGMEEKSYNERTCIIVIERNDHKNNQLVGVVVDTVSEVVSIQPKDVEPPPQCGAEIDLLIGLGKIKDKVIIILDIDNIISREDLILIKDKLTALQTKVAL